MLKDLNVPVFGTLLTLGLLENKLREHELLNQVTCHTVVPGETVKLGADESRVYTHKSFYSRCS